MEPLTRIGSANPQPSLPGTDDRDEAEIRERMRTRNAFVGTCDGYSCGRRLYRGERYVHGAHVGLYCARCWREIVAEKIERAPMAWS